MEKEEKQENLKEKVSDVKEKVTEVFGNIAEKVGEKNNDNKKKVKPLVTSRVLFVSILDKLYFIGLVLAFVGTIWGWVSNKLYLFDYSNSFFYELGSWLGGFLGILVVFAICYFILNWLYRCIAKTMLCLTENEIYGEVYAPFYRGELSIPIEKVTKVDTVKVLWIFRTLFIHRYHQLPIVFPTWNAQEFKDKMTELLMKRDSKVDNEFESKNIFPEWLKKRMLIVLITLAAILGLVLIIYVATYLNNPYKKIDGTYVNATEKIVLKDDQTCELKNVIGYEVTKCSWEANDKYGDSIRIDVDLTYRYKSNWSNKYYTSDRSINLYFDTDEQVITYDSTTYTKEK